MTSITKGALRAAKAALDTHNYAEAERQARTVLEADSKHYNATVFLGLALEKQGKDEESDRVYGHARTAKPRDPLALQGLVTLYEKQATKKVDEYRIVAQLLAELYMEVDDKHRCQTVIDKYIEFAKQHGTQPQYKSALELILPDSALYDYLEGRIPQPALTYAKVIEIVESEEKQRINKLIGERRTRIGARIGQVTEEVKREVFGKSNLESLYQAVIDWSLDDDARHMYEERLLQRAYDTLAVLLPGDKPGKRVQVQKLSKDMVILKRAFALAWKVVLEWEDVGDISQLDVQKLWQYVELFPDDGLTKILRGFLESDASSFMTSEKVARKPDENSELDEPLTAEERLFFMSDGLEQSSRALLSQRLMAVYFLHLQEYANAVDCAQKAISLLEIERNVSGLDFQNSLDAINVSLATALVHHQSPRNHPRARQLFDEILKRKPSDTSALVGVGFILVEEEDYDGAYDFLSQALQRSQDIKVRSEAAWCQALAGNLERGLKELRICLEELDASDSGNRVVKSELHYRVGECMWKLETSKAARKDRNGAYGQFIASLKADLNFAPAYTSLGIYYADYAKDRTRARKCFQKAFELSPAEVEAAKRLASAFADHGEWDLVETVSQRVIDSGKVRPPPGSKKKGLSWPFAALGVCQLNSQDYAQGIVSFQAALRISPEDVHAWTGLGECYHNSGRYVAATRAFEQAQKLQEHASGGYGAWFSKYMLGNVKRELGDFEVAIEKLEDVLVSQPEEFGVGIALLQTCVENASANISLGMFGRARDKCMKAIDIASDLIVLCSSAFNFWKALGDACAIFSKVQIYACDFPKRKVTDLLKEEMIDDMYSSLQHIDGLGAHRINSLMSEDVSIAPMHAAILAHKRAIFWCSNDIHAQAVAWYNLGWTQYQTSFCSSVSKKVDQHLKAAVQCFKHAIELEAGNSEFWNSLGIVTTLLNPKVAQHAFVRCLHLNDRSACTWTNLGTLYLLQDDVQLANEAFTRGQSADPEYAHAWLGQGVVALRLGENHEAHELFTQAFEIADAFSLFSKKMFSLSSFDQILSSKQIRQTTDLLQPLFALHQLRSQLTGAIEFGYLSALISERIGEYTEPVSILTDICAHLEAEYEKCESDQVLARFAQAKADLGRAQLCAGDFESASSNAETALNLSSEEFDKANSDVRRKFRLSAHLTCGLAQSALKDTDAAVSMFRAALEESDQNPDVICLLAQLLWAKGGEPEQGVVREQLFDCIERNPDHVSAVCLLAVIAILDNDRETLGAVAADLHNIRTREDVEEMRKLSVGHLSAAIAKSPGPSGIMNGSDVLEDEVSEAASSILLSPAAPHGWSQLTEVADVKDLIPAQMALVTAIGAVPPKGELDAETLAKALAGTSIVADAQRAIMLAPSFTTGWRILA